MKSLRAAGLAPLLLLLACPALQAAGGHHAVDDAALLEPGQCQAELWRERGDDTRRLLHLGGACRLGALEWGLNLDRSRAAAEPRQRIAGLQLKWAAALRPELSAGLVWAAGWQRAAPGSTGFAGQSLLLPLSWQAHDALALHLTLGRDFLHRTPDATRRGLALEWRVVPRWQALAEVFHDGQRAQGRLGLRFQPVEGLDLDLSRAVPRGAAHEAWWSLGLGWTFER